MEGIPHDKVHPDTLAAIAADLAASDPHPVGSIAYVTDHDGTTLGPFHVVRSYWPKPVCELVTDDPKRGMIRQNHDRMKPTPPNPTPPVSEIPRP